MKSSIILVFVTHALAAAAQPRENARSVQLDPVVSRTIVMPEVPVRTGQVTPGDGTWGGKTPDPDKVQIVGLTYGGSGCPSQSVDSILSDDGQIMTVIFDKYIASLGPDVGIAENRKNCQLNINIRYPGGFQFSIFSADYRGYANLDKGVSGTQKSTYYFSGQTEQTSSQTTWEGPYEEDFVLHDESPATSTIWSPCGANGMLNINSQVRLTTTDSNARGLITNDSLDASFKQEVHLRGQNCTEPDE